MMSKEGQMPADYIAEQVREAIAHEAHDLGVIVTVSETEAVLEGCVETDGQRQRVEEIARRILAELPVNNKIEIIDLGGVVKQESLS
jgi:osmotically-inducible protein OsmY